jgi:hypothetical protein
VKSIANALRAERTNARQLAAFSSPAGTTDNSPAIYRGVQMGGDFLSPAGAKEIGFRGLLKISWSTHALLAAGKRSALHQAKLIKLRAKVGSGTKYV